MSADAHAQHHHTNYFKIYLWLLVLLTISILGPMLEIRVVTLITAFGIALVKAYIVASRFMHLDIEKKYITYMLATCLIFMFLFFTATAPDILKDSGANWTKPSYDPQYVELSPGASGAHGDGHGGGHGEAHGDGHH